MSFWPTPLDGQQFIDEGMLTASSTGTTATANASANTKGSYAQLVASTPFDAAGFLLYIVTNAVAVNRSFLLDIAVGAGGSEKVIASNILLDSSATSISQLGLCVFIPIPIPSGTRIAARVQCSTGSGAIKVGITLIAGGLLGIPNSGRLTDIGALTASSLGTQIDPGAVLNTKGSYAQLTASTVSDSLALILAFTSNNNSATSTATWLVDIAIGSTVKIPNILLCCTAAFHILPAIIGPVPFRVPAGSQIQVRAQCSITDATDRLFTVAGYLLG